MNETPQWAKKLAVFDTETTGISTSISRIVTCYVGLLDEAGQAVEEKSWLIDPGVEIPWQATKVHGITTQMAQENGQPAPEAVREITEYIKGFFEKDIPVCAYNAPYDFSILNSENIRYGYAPLMNPSPIVDPLILDKEVDRYRRGKRTLTDTSNFYQVQLESAHEARSDAVTAGRVAQAIAQKFADQLDYSAQDLHSQQIFWAKDQAESLTDYMRNKRGQADFYADGSWPMH